MKRYSTNSSFDSKNELFSFGTLKEKECTTNCFGREPVEQECYYCIYCDPKKRERLCKFCYQSCHEQCRDICEDEIMQSQTKHKENNAYDGSFEFTCDCGLLLKHIIKPVEKKEIISCPLQSVDSQFLNGQTFYCIEDQMNLCSMCFFICHKECVNKKQSKTVDGEKSGIKCECKDSNHTIFNEFTFQIPIFDYQNEIKTSFWPIQMINLMFSTGTIFKELSKLFKDTLANYNPKKVFSKEHSFPFLLEQFSNTFNRKFKTFYYHENIESMFPFEQLVSFMKKINVKNQQMALVKFRLMFILLFGHLKKDFITIKSYTSIDFLISTITERLQMRKFIFTKSKYTMHIHNKYHFANMQCGVLKEIALDDFCPFMEIGIQKKLLNVFEFQDELEIGLKFICFLLKRMLLNIDELETLIKKLYNFHRKVISNIKFTDLDSIRTWLDLFNAFAEIFYMIPAEYNDLIIEEYLQCGEFKHNFIQCKSEHGLLLFKMIIKSCIIVSKHYKLIKSKGDFKSEEEALILQEDENEEDENKKKTLRKRRINPNGVDLKKPDIGILYEKVLTLFHEAIRILCVTDNSYYYQLTKITKDNIVTYYDNIKTIETLKLFNIGDELRSKREPSKINNYNNNRSFDLVLSLENLLRKLFLNSYDVSNESIIVDELISEYKKFQSKMRENVNEYLIQKPELKEEDYKFVFKVLERSEHFNLFLVKNELNFSYSKLINELKFSHIDEVSLKILIFFSNKRFYTLITFELVEIIFSILLLFLLTENGTRYLLTGKTLTRINKLFHRQSFTITTAKNDFTTALSEQNIKITTVIFDFLEVLIKAIKKYNIDLTGHKVLLRLKKNFLLHLNQYFTYITNNKSKDTEGYYDIDEHTNNFKQQFNIVIEIFIHLWNFYPEKEKKKIHKSILKLFLSKNYDFLNPTNFFNYYYKDYDDKGLPIRITTNGKNDEILSKRTINDEIDTEERKNLILSENKFDTKKKNNINHELDISSNLLENERIEIKLFFSFFKLLSNYGNFVKEKNLLTLEPLYKFFEFDDGDEKAILRLFKCGKLRLKEKSIILNVMQRMFFIEKVTEDNFEYMNKQITTTEYLDYIISNKITLFPSIKPKPSDNISSGKMNPKYLTDIDYKIRVIKRIEFLVNIYISELEYFPLNTNEEKPKDIKAFTKSLLFGIKRICDFYYLERELWNKPFVLFYKLAIKFLPKTEIIMNILLNEGFKPMQKSYQNDDNQESVMEKIKSINFNIFERDEIYKYMSNALDLIFKKTKINYDFSLEKFLDVYDNTQEYNFTPFSLLETKDYEYFYEEDKEEGDDVNDEKLAEIKAHFIEEFLDVNKTNYLSVIQSLSNDSSKVNYRHNIVDYFKSFLSVEKSDDVINTLLCFMTKTLFYDTSPLQKTFKMTINNQFFIYFNNLLQKNVYRSFVMCKNIYDSEAFITTASFTKLTLQFLQLLGEDFCTDFHDKIFTKLPDDPNKTSIFENIIKSLKQTIVFIKLSIDIQVELPYDKLIVLLSNLIDFIVEFLVTKKEYSAILQKEIEKLLFEPPAMIDILRLKCDPKAITRMKIISFVKVKFIQLLRSYIQNGKKHSTIKKLLNSEWSPIELYNEILYNFQLLINEIEREIPKKAKDLMKINNHDSFVNYLINLYINEPKFRETLQLNVCFNLYILIKIYETKYQKLDIKEHFRKREFENKGINIHTIQTHHTHHYKDDEENSNKWNLYSDNAYRIYKFLEQLILFVEVKTEGTIDLTEETIDNTEVDIVIEQVEQDEKAQKENLQITFFIRPYLTYFISKQTLNSFENFVDRESATAKYIGLVNSSDYFLFEMLVNKKTTSQSKISKFFSDFQYNIVEWINFLFIIFNNGVLLYDNYKSWRLPLEQYNKRNNDEYDKFNIINFLISIIQICFISIVLIIWFKYKFWLNYENYILKNNNMTFIYRQKSDGGQKKISKIVRSYFSENCDATLNELLNDINNEIPLFTKIYTGIWDSLLTNREICVLVYNFICIILYIVIGNTIFLVIPMLFLANLSPIIFAILKAFASKMPSFGMVLIFAYLSVYFFMWITYYFLADNFIFGDVFDKTTGNRIEEAFCYSTIQCWMFIVSMGIRAGGGIADALGRVSFRTDYKYFILRFFYDMLFHLIIVLLLLNMLLAITVDAFAELRILNGQRERDMKNICFICQLSRDDCLAKNIDFDEHVKKTHYLWNYVYFLTYLHLENVNDFNRVKKYVWDKLGNQDYSWIPLEGRK